MVNVNDLDNVKLTGDNLHVELVMFPPEPSSTGKMLMVASSHGYEKIEAKYKGKPFTAMVCAGIAPNGKHPYIEVNEPRAKMVNGTLILDLPMNEPYPSSTGKANIVGSTGGFFNTNIEVNGKNVRINFLALQK